MMVKKRSTAVDLLRLLTTGRYFLDFLLFEADAGAGASPDITLASSIAVVKALTGGT
jgi:hypothetical protein